MTARLALIRPSRTAVERILLAFDGSHLAVETNIPEVAAIVREAHASMIATSDEEPGTTVSVWRRDDRYTVGALEFSLEVAASRLAHMVKLEILLNFVTMRSELLWLHSGVVSRGELALLIVAPSAGGKSTLVTHLCALGWDYMSDEAAPLDARRGIVHPWPRTPVRRGKVGRVLSKQELGEIGRERPAIPDEQIRRRSARVAGIVFPSYSFGSQAALTAVTPGTASLELVSAMVNFVDHKDDAVGMLAQIASRVPAHRLAYHDGVEAGQIVDAEYRRRWDGTKKAVRKAVKKGPAH